MAIAARQTQTKQKPPTGQITSTFGQSTAERAKSGPEIESILIIAPRKRSGALRNAPKCWSTRPRQTDL